jgi:futalosine hydrolase
MKTMVIVASTPFEIGDLLQSAAATALTGKPPLQAFRGRIADREVILAVTGIGKVNAASALTALCERFTPELVLNVGCGGAFHGSGLAVGDLAIAASESFADEGVLTPEGWHGLELIGIPVCELEGERLFNTIPLPAAPAADALRLARTIGINAALGPFLTVSTCSGTSRRGEELLRRFPGICENMEGAALAQVALRYGVPLLEVRGISNLVEDRDLARWDLKAAVSRAQQFLLGYLQSLSPPSPTP